MGVARAASERACIYPDRANARIIPNSSAFIFLFACSLQAADCQE
jgi:hypothetical protein